MPVVSFESAEKLAEGVNGAAATGLITVPDPAHLTDGQTISIDDGTNAPSVFEMDTAGDGAANIQVDTSAIADEDKTALAAAIAGVINGIGAGLTVTATAIGEKIALLADASDTTHNVRLTQSSAAVKFKLEGMAGGLDAVAQANIQQITERDGRWFLFHS